MRRATRADAPDHQLRMDEVPYIDSGGAAALESFAQRARANGKRVIVREPREQPRLLLARP